MSKLEVGVYPHNIQTTYMMAPKNVSKTLFVRITIIVKIAIKRNFHADDDSISTHIE